VGEEEEYTVEKSITEGIRSFGGRMVRSPDVVATMEREGSRRKKGGGRKKSSAKTLYTQRASASLASYCDLRESARVAPSYPW
jgi:hypothetical protein